MKPSLAKLEQRLAVLENQRLRPIIVWCDAAGEIPEIVASALASGQMTAADRERCVFVHWLKAEPGDVPAGYHEAALRELETEDANEALARKTGTAAHGAGDAEQTAPPPRAAYRHRTG